MFKVAKCVMSLQWPLLFVLLESHTAEIWLFFQHKSLCPVKRVFLCKTCVNSTTVSELSLQFCELILTIKVMHVFSHTWMIQLSSVNFLLHQLDFTTLLIGTQNGQLQLYDLRQPNDALNFSSPHGYQINDIQKSADETFLLSSSKDKTAQLHEAKTLQALKKYKFHFSLNLSKQICMYV